jgi:predicted nucleic acid-binding protein
MSGGLSAFVVDASVAVKLVLPEPLAENAERLFATLDSGVPARAFVPDLFYPECANVLWKSARRLRLPNSSAMESMEELLLLELERVPSTALASAALETALNEGVTVYDAMYVALSDRLQVPLVTADEKMVLRLKKNTRHDIRWLGDL